MRLAEKVVAVNAAGLQLVSDVKRTAKAVGKSPIDIYVGVWSPFRADLVV